MMLSDVLSKMTVCFPKFLSVFQNDRFSVFQNDRVLCSKMTDFLCSKMTVVPLVAGTSHFDVALQPCSWNILARS